MFKRISAQKGDKLTQIFILLFILPIFLMFFLSCMSLNQSGSEKSLSFRESHDNFIQFLNEHPDYQPLSSRVNLIQLTEYADIIPLSYDKTPANRTQTFRMDTLFESGPKVYYLNGFFYYFYVIKGMIKGVKIDLKNRTYSNVDVSSNKHFAIYRDPANEKLELIPFGRDFTKTKVVSSKGGSLPFYGTHEALCLDPPLYIYESSREGFPLESFLIIPRDLDGLGKIMYEENYYKNGYNLVTGLDKKGFDRNGYDKDGYAHHGYNRKGYDRDGNNYSGPIGANGKTGFGTLKWANGDVYHGYFQNNEINGMGIINGTDGAIYAGSFQEEMKIGQGLLYSPDGTKKLVSWKDGEMYIISSNPGQVIEPDGEWAFLGKGVKNGLAQGRGDAVGIKSGWIITNGLFEQGRLIEGSLLTVNGTSYRGRFTDGLLSDGKILSANGTAYTGHLRNGIPDGAGQQVDKDGIFYEGNFSNGRFEGNGELTLQNGDVYNGAFVNGVPHGSGIYKNSTEGSIEKCEFYEGKRIDQLYLMKIALAEEEDKKLAEGERLKLEEEVRLREEKARQQAAENVEKKASKKNLFGAFVAGASTVVVGNAYGLDSSDTLLLATAAAKDVISDTDGENIRAMSDTLIENKKQMKTWESKYGQSDLSNVSGSNTFLSQKQQPLQDINNNPADKNPVLTNLKSRASSNNAEIPKKNPLAEPPQMNKEIKSENNKLLDLPKSNKSGRSVLRGLIDRDVRYSPEYRTGEVTFRNPQTGIESITIKLNNGAIGELTWNGNYKWIAANGYNQKSPYLVGCVVELSSEQNKIYVLMSHNDVVPTDAGDKYGYNLAWSANGSTLKSVSGSQFTPFSKEETSAIFEDLHYSSYQPTAAWLVW